MDRRSFLKLFGAGAAATATVGLATAEPRVLSDGVKLWVPPEELVVPKPNEIVVATRLEDVKAIRKNYVDMWITRMDVDYRPVVDVTSFSGVFRQYNSAGIDVRVEAVLANTDEVDFVALQQAVKAGRPVRWHLEEQI